jgi:hypothetical protein
MRLRPLLLVALAGALSEVPGAPGGPRPALAEEPVLGGDGATVALLATQPRAEHTSVYLSPVGGSDAGPPVATFTHLEDAVVRASTLPGEAGVLAIADTAPTRDASFAASLFLLVPHAPPARLVDGVVHASRPLVTDEGRVFVSRGVAGPEPTAPGSTAPSMRVDALSIDEIDVQTGVARPVHTVLGQLAFLAGSLGSEVIVYRVTPGGTDLIAVDADTGTVRVVLPALLPFARDFSVERESGTLLLQERHESDSRRWVIDRVDLDTGRRSRLHESTSMALAPHAWPGGRLAFTPDRRGLAIEGLDRASPLGEGVDAVLATSADDCWAAALHTAPGARPVPFAIDTATGAPAAIPAPRGARVTIAGFIAPPRALPGSMGDRDEAHPGSGRRGAP